MRNMTDGIATLWRTAVRRGDTEQAAILADRYNRAIMRGCTDALTSSGKRIGWLTADKAMTI